MTSARGARLRVSASAAAPSPSMPEQKWPDRLWIVRHGQSAGNVARDAAEEAGLPRIDIATRDADAPLSMLGKVQSEALGAWFRQMVAAERPTVVLSSPYARSMQTAQIVVAEMGGSGNSPQPIPDERLREKEFGILDRMTIIGIKQCLP